MVCDHEPPYSRAMSAKTRYCATPQPIDTFGIDQPIVDRWSAWQRELQTGHTRRVSIILVLPLIPYAFGQKGCLPSPRHRQEYLAFKGAVTPSTHSLPITRVPSICFVLGFLSHRLILLHHAAYLRQPVFDPIRSSSHWTTVPSIPCHTQRQFAVIEFYSLKVACDPPRT